METKAEKYIRLKFQQDRRMFRWMCCNMICNIRYHGNEEEFHTDPEAAVAWVEKEFDETYPGYERGK